MIGTILKVAWLRLRRDRAALLVTFVLPLIFFSIFAVIFGSSAGGGMAPVELVVVDEDGSTAARRFVGAIRKEEGLTGPGSEFEQPLEVSSREEARRRVKEGECDVAVVIPAGFELGFSPTGGDSGTVVLFADTVANPVAYQVVQGLLQSIAMTGMPDLMVEDGIGMFAQLAGGLTDEQEAAMNGLLAELEEMSISGEDGESDGGGMGAPVPVEIEDVSRRAEDEERQQRVVAFQAAGIGVMFLLFSMSAAAQLLLQEEQSGTLERVLTADVGMGQLLTGYWIYAALLGCVQVTVMFVWGWAVFGLDLWNPAHLPGFVLMTLVTAGAAAALGLVLGTACRTQAQLGGISTIVILTMSAVGGSMVPRFVLRQNPLLDKLGLATFNAWAIDGYQKIFWYETGLLSIWPQVLVLSSVTVVFLAIARVLARRWETV